MVKVFFYNGHMLKEINKIFITSITKSKNLKTSNPFRPISFCKACCKIIAKILNNRVKHLLDKVVSPLQGAFAPSRLINDNIMLSHEIMHSFKKKKGKLGIWLLNSTWKRLMIYYN